MVKHVVGGEVDTDERDSMIRLRSGERPDLIGWEQIAASLGISERQARRWGRLGLPFLAWGPSQVAAFRGEVYAWAGSRRLAAAA